MSGFSQGDVQKSLFQYLQADAPLATLVQAIYEHVPARATFPYITISDVTARDWSSKTTQGARLSIGLHVYSRYAGTKEAAAILKRLYGLLHDSALAVDGQAFASSRVESSIIMKDGDGVTYHGILRLAIVTQATA